jgi:acetyltransferase-like isoleucine patch superfamily enzyme
MLSVVVADKIELGPGAVIETLTLVYRPEVLSMGERSRIASFVRIIGQRGRVNLKSQTFVGLGCLVDSTGDFALGARSQIGPRCTLYSHGATGLLYNCRFPHRVGRIAIGADSWLGMGCIVHPQVTIGDRVITLPGLVIRGDVPSDTALIPPATEYRMVPTSLLLVGVTDEVQQQKIEELFSRLAAANPEGVIDKADERVWRLQLPRRNFLYLIRDRSLRISNSEMLGNAVIWTLCHDAAVSGVPSFCFDKLIVTGPWTRFAEQMASFLCRKGGAHFVFESEVQNKEAKEVAAK